MLLLPKLDRKTAANFSFENDGEAQHKGFKVPYINGQWIVPPLFLISVAVILYNMPHFFADFFSLHDAENPAWMPGEVLLERIPHYLLTIVIVGMVVLTTIKRLSLIPVLGMLSCFYLLAELGITNWLRFIIWLIIGMVVYFAYGRRRSHLARADASA